MKLDDHDFDYIEKTITGKKNGDLIEDDSPISVSIKNSTSLKMSKKRSRMGSVAPKPIGIKSNLP
jgi:hypothetical protein